MGGRHGRLHARWMPFTTILGVACAAGRRQPAPRCAMCASWTPKRWWLPPRGAARAQRPPQRPQPPPAVPVLTFQTARSPAPPPCVTLRTAPVSSRAPWRLPTLQTPLPSLMLPLLPHWHARPAGRTLAAKSVYSLIPLGSLKGSAWLSGHHHRWIYNLGLTAVGDGTSSTRVCRWRDKYRQGREGGGRAALQKQQQQQYKRRRKKDAAKLGGKHHYGCTFMQPG